jgi:hypothetical protein
LLIVVAAVLVALMVPLAGGHFANLTRVTLRGAWLVAAALVVQIVIISIIDTAPDWLSRTIHLSTYLALGVFIVLNRHIPWMWLIGLGTLANVVVITANGGVMPASRRALAASGRELKEGFNNSTIVANPRLSFLGDVMNTPKWLPLANVFSIGDVLLIAGLVLVVFTVSRTDPASDVPYLRPLESTAA